MITLMNVLLDLMSDGPKCGPLSDVQPIFNVNTSCLQTPIIATLCVEYSLSFKFKAIVAGNEVARVNGFLDVTIVIIFHSI